MPRPPQTDTAIFCARTNRLCYVVYFNSRRKEDATAHLKVAYHLNADDANAMATYKLHFGGPISILHAAPPADAKSDVVVLVAVITGEQGWKIHDAMAAWMEIMIMINVVEAAEKEGSSE